MLVGEAMSGFIMTAERPAVGPIRRLRCHRSSLTQPYDKQSTNHKDSYRELCRIRDAQVREEDINLLPSVIGGAEAEEGCRFDSGDLCDCWLLKELPPTFNNREPRHSLTIALDRHNVQLPPSPGLKTVKEQPVLGVTQRHKKSRQRRKTAEIVTGSQNGLNSHHKRSYSDSSIMGGVVATHNAQIEINSNPRNTQLSALYSHSFPSSSWFLNDHAAQRSKEWENKTNSNMAIAAQPQYANYSDVYAYHSDTYVTTHRATQMLTGGNTDDNGNYVVYLPRKAPVNKARRPANFHTTSHYAHSENYVSYGPATWTTHEDRNKAYYDSPDYDDVFDSEACDKQKNKNRAADYRPSICKDRSKESVESQSSVGKLSFVSLFFIS